jgi:hypothetical protein
MIFYKSIRFIDGKLRTMIINEYGDIVRNPTSNDMKMAIFGEPPKKCYVCGTDNGGWNWRRDYDNKGNLTGRYLCKSCWDMHSPNSGNNIIKSMANLRRGLLVIDNEKGKGIISEAVVAKIRKLDILCIEMDNFNYVYDLSIDPEYGIIQVKARHLHYGEWGIGHFNNMDFDNLFFICMDEFWENIDRMYVIPIEDIPDSLGISIYKNPSRGEWYRNFRIEEKHYNDAYHNLISFIRHKQYFGIEDIKKWMTI